MTRRKYKTGSQWALWRWSETASEYLTRLHLVKTPWFALALHWIKKPDPEPYLHDHPVSFLSLVLRGWYTESRSQGLPVHDKAEVVTRKWFNFFTAGDWDRHSIDRCAPNTLTLCFMGPKVREWGFHTPQGWVYWRDYYREQRAK